MELERCKKEFTVSEELYRSGAISLQQYDDSKARLRRAELQYEMVKDSLSRLLEKQHWEKDIAKLNYEKAKVAVDRIIKEEKELMVRTPINGRVISINSNTGSAVEGAPLFVIADFTDLSVTAFIDAHDAAKVMKGQKIQVLLEAYGHSLEGAVDFVDMKVVQDNFGGDRTNKIEVRGKLKGPFPDTLKLGAAVELEIVTAESRNVPVLPIEAVMEEDGRLFVYAVQSGKAVKKEVETGVSGVDLIELKKGLAVNDVVVTRGNLDLKEGEKVLWK